VIYSSTEHISNLIEILPTISTKLAELSTDNSENFDRIGSEVGKILDGLQKVDNKLSLGDTALGRRPSQIDERSPIQSIISSPAESSSLLKSLANPSADGDCILQALELLGPVARKALPEFYLRQHLQLSKESYAWIMADLQRLLGEVHLAASQAHVDNLICRLGEEPAKSLTINIPKRFRHSVIVDHHRGEDPSNKRTNDIEPSAASAAVLSKVSTRSDLHYTHHFSDPTGDFYSSFDGKNVSSAQPQQFTRVALCFIPHKRYVLPGIAFACCRLSRDEEHGSDSVITAFDVIPGCAPIIRDIRSGDIGVSQVLKRLKAGEIWAGDRDDTGRSLLSVSATLPQEIG
jgi:hypothetical protein